MTRMSPSNPAGAAPARREADPTGKQPHEPGAKLDAGKVPAARGTVAYFPRALLAVAEVSAVGAAKYSWNGWENVEDGISRYEDALTRHQLYAASEGGFESRNVARDQDTGLLHLAHMAWNVLAVLELVLREQEGAPSLSEADRGGD